MEVLIDSSWGIYIPQVFVEREDPEAWGLTDEEVAVLKSGPDHPAYWGVWEDVVDGATLEEDGKVYRLFEDGDLFLIEEGEDPYADDDEQEDF